MKEVMVVDVSKIPNNLELSRNRSLSTCKLLGVARPMLPCDARRTMELRKWRAWIHEAPIF